MRQGTRLIVLLVSLIALAAMWPDTAQAQRRHPVKRGMVVLIGGYLYDPYSYFPVYDYRAEVRVLVTPEEASVYVDGFYAGIVDDFNGFFQGLPLPPGGHDIVLYLEGYRTVHQRVYLMPASIFKLHHVMQRLPAGEISEPPTVAPPSPAPPVGSATPLRTPPRTSPLSRAPGFDTGTSSM